MDQKVLIDSIGKHLDLLEKLSVWIFLLSLTIGWARLKRGNISALGMSFDVKEAFAGVAIIFLVANMVVIILIFRLGDLLTLVDAQSFPEAFTTLSTHTWIMNPFAFFGTSRVASLYNTEGFGVLVVLWWLCHSSLWIMIDGTPSRFVKYLSWLFVTLGFIAMVAVQRVNWIVVTRSADLRNDVSEGPLRESFRARNLEAVLGAVVGVLLFQSVRAFAQRIHSGQDGAAAKMGHSA